MFAQSYADGETPWPLGRAARELPVQVPGMQLDRRCGGGLQAVATAAMMVQSGAADIVLAGGVESMSNVEHYTTDVRWGKRSGSVTLHDRLDRGRERSQPVERFGVISGMIETAENLARDFEIRREDADAFALRSHQRAAAAWNEGRFEDEVVAVSVPRPKGEPAMFARDETFRADASLDALAGLRTVMKDGTVTAGNASQQNDGAAACLVVAEEMLGQLRLTPEAVLLGWAAAGCEPSHMGIGPVPAVERLLGRLRVGLDQIDLVEINEAFACQVLAVLKGLRWNDAERLNVNGSGISLGHPIAATGVRIMCTLLHELRRRRGRLGLETMCIGGGQGLAALFERV
jgi:acetyl-CoA C-acetyltransferase